MKKIGVIAVVIFSIIILGIFFINDNESKVAEKNTKVGVICIGECDDNSWGMSHYEGMEICAQKLELDVVYKENVPCNEYCVRVMEDLISEGCEIIVCNSFDYGQWELEVAARHPEVYFFHATGTEESDNLSTYFGRIYQARYLSGIVAGLQTETNEIGYVAAYQIPEVNRGINAFTLGVRLVNKDANVYVEWCNSWTGDVEAENAVNKLIEEHNIDVIAMHTDSIRPLEIADEKGIWSIGYNVDNSDMFPDTYLTAPVWDWASFYEPRIQECINGKFVSKHYWEGMDTGVVDIAPLTDNVKDGVAQIVEREKEKLLNNTYDVFYGPITDKAGVVRVKEGENMSDNAMLNEFDWYVEGVVIGED